MTAGTTEGGGYAFAQRAVAGAVAGMVESAVTSPFEVLKTNMQIHRRPHPTMRRAAQTILAGKGVAGFYYGLPACLLQNCGKVALRFSSYGYFTDAFDRVLSEANHSAEFSGGALHRFASGFCAGCTESLWIAPCERLKTLRVTELAVNSAQHEFTSLYNASKVLMYGRTGLADFYVGFVPTALRNGLAIGTRFTFYSQLRSTLRTMQGGEDKWWNGIACGFAVGIGTTVLTQPLDVIKSQMQGGRRGEYASTLACFRATLRAEGVGGFSRGFAARLCKIATGQAVIFGIYEAVASIISTCV